MIIFGLLAQLWQVLSSPGIHMLMTVIRGLVAIRLGLCLYSEAQEPESSALQARMILRLSGFKLSVIVVVLSTIFIVILTIAFFFLLRVPCAQVTSGPIRPPHGSTQFASLDSAFSSRQRAMSFIAYRRKWVGDAGSCLGAYIQAFYRV